MTHLRGGLGGLLLGLLLELHLPLLLVGHLLFCGLVNTGVKTRQSWRQIGKIMSCEKYGML